MNGNLDVSSDTSSIRVAVSCNPRSWRRGKTSISPPFSVFQLLSSRVMSVRHGSRQEIQHRMGIDKVNSWSLAAGVVLQAAVFRTHYVDEQPQDSFPEAPTYVKNTYFGVQRTKLPAPPNYPLRHPKYHLTETIRALIEVQLGGLGRTQFFLCGATGIGSSSKFATPLRRRTRHPTATPLPCRAKSVLQNR